MRSIAATLVLIIATIVAMLAMMFAGSVRAGGALALLWALTLLWWVKVDAWPMLKSVWRELLSR